MKLTSLLLAVAASAVLIACGESFQKTPILKDPYRFITEGDDTVTASHGDFMGINFTFVLAEDTLASNAANGFLQIVRFDSTQEALAGLWEVLGMMSPGDSVHLKSNAMMFLKNVMRSPLAADTLDSAAVVNVYLGLDRFFEDQASVQAYSDSMLSVQAAKELDKLAAYMAENEPDLDSTAEGNYVKIITEGNGKAVKVGDEVAMRYRGMLLDGTEFDSNMDSTSEPFRFTLGAGQVIRGWDQTIEGLPVGTEARIYLPSKNAYGRRGAGGRIPPLSTLVFDLEVLYVVQKPDSTAAPAE